MKIKSTYATAALLSISLLGSLPLTSFAAEGDAASTVTSKGEINFKADSTPTYPVDPTNPEDPKPPVDPNPGTPGPLAIDFASSFKFGEQIISTKNETYYAAAQTFTDGDTGPNYVQVTDKRGTFEGWTLSVAQSGQFATADTDGSKELTGAALTLGNGEVDSVTDLAYKPGTVAAETTLVPDQKVELVAANTDQGMGTWVYRFGNKENTNADASVALSVPGKTPKMAKQYSTTLNWSLETIPANLNS